MNMKDFFQHIGGHFKREQPQSELPDEVVEKFLRVLDEVRREDMPCEKVFAKLDEYVDKEMNGEDVSLLMPLLREHLDICPECCEEYEALLDWLPAHMNRDAVVIVYFAGLATVAPTGDVYLVPYDGNLTNSSRSYPLKDLEAGLRRLKAKQTLFFFDGMVARLGGDSRAKPGHGKGPTENAGNK